MSIRNLEWMMRPTSVAVIGPSNKPGNIGGIILRNMLRGGFNGPIMPVNPRYQAVAGILTYPDVPSLPLAPDVAILCTPPVMVPGLIHQLGVRGTRAAVVITAGLSEQKTSEGITLQEAMLAAAKPHCLRILGPNCVGLLIPTLGLNATFAHTGIDAGSIAFVSQSGGFCTATLDWARSRGIGFSYFISLGNSADVDFGDVLDYLASDAQTSAILLYMESIGRHEARKFMSAARAASRNKPVLAIKAGRSPAAAKAAFSHTGALAGADNVYAAALRRAGILRVNTIDELFDAVETLARSKPLRGNRLAILTNGGGPGVIATDALIAEGGQLAELSGMTLKKLNERLPGTWSHGNPVDMIGDADAQTYRDSLQILLQDEGVDAVLVLNAPSALAPPVAAARGVVELVQQADRPILTSWLGGEAAQQARQVFAAAQIPTYNTPEQAVRAFMHMVRYHRNQDILNQVPPSMPTDFSPWPGVAKVVIDNALAENRQFLSEPEAKEVLAAYGLTVVETRIATDVADAVEQARAIGLPVALKILSADITHKSDVGGVALGLESLEEVQTAAQTMLQRISKKFPQAHISGFTVQQMASRPAAHELIIGMTTDEVFGPVLVFGQGGTAVEVIGDRTIALPPMNMSLARYTITRTEIFKLLQGYRDRPPADLDAIALALVQVSQLIIDRPEIVELDINPLFADHQGVLALDARMRIAPAPQGGPSRLAIRPYPQGLEETVYLHDGQEVLIRPIRPEDQPAHAEFISRLLPEDLRFRFLGVIRDVPTSEMARLVQIDYDREMAFIATTSDTTSPQTLAVVRTMTQSDNSRADFAVMVRSDLKHLGLGQLMMEKIIRYCRERGTAEIVGQVLRDNEPMLNLIRKLGFKVIQLDGTDRVEVRMELKAS
ncbi:MAG: Protein lysine acetyltransferase Pat [Phycisphaerae bacterium]|nr:Protein lysine acetyltransferase Pat [Phycisphaerae bacterium]